MMVRILTSVEVDGLLDYNQVLDSVEYAFIKQGRDEIVRPERLQFHVGTPTGDGKTGMGLTMPAYILGADYYSTKLVNYDERNRERNLPTVQAQIAVTNADSGEPEAYMEGTSVGNARTGAIGGVTARAMATGPVRIGIFGAGQQARWQARLISTAIEVSDIRVYSPSDSKYECAEELDQELEPPVSAVEAPASVLSGADIVVTATTSTEPVFSGDQLEPSALIIAIGSFTPELHELPPEVLEHAAQVFADVPTEAVETGDLLATDLEEEDITPLSAALDRPDDFDFRDGPIVMTSVGSAVLDAAVSESLVKKAKQDAVGMVIDMDDG